MIYSHNISHIIPASKMDMSKGREGSWTLRETTAGHNGSENRCNLDTDLVFPSQSDGPGHVIWILTEEKGKPSSPNWDFDSVPAKMTQGTNVPSPTNVPWKFRDESAKGHPTSWPS